MMSFETEPDLAQAHRCERSELRWASSYIYPSERACRHGRQAGQGGYFTGQGFGGDG